MGSMSFKCLCLILLLVHFPSKECSAASSAVYQQQQQYKQRYQPNIIFLNVDSMDGRLVTPDSPAPTPNLKKLAASGMTFLNTYS